MINMLEHGKSYFPESYRISSWLMKLYGKLGMMTLVQHYSDKMTFFENKDDLNFQRLGAAKLSYFSDFGMHENLESILSEYKDFYRDKINENKNMIVTGFLHREFDCIWALMRENEQL